MPRIRAALLLTICVASVALVACRSRLHAAVCVVEPRSASVDFAGPLRPTQAHEAQSDEVMSCQVGDYVVIVPRRAGSGEVTLVRNKRVSFMSHRGDTYVFDADGTHVAFASVKETDGVPKHVSYAVFDSTRQTWVENVDVDGDGRPDLRTTEHADTSTETEFRVGERWLERVIREGHVGTILDGRFVTIEDARAALNQAATTGPTR